MVLILLFIVHVFCLCIVVIVFQDTSSRCIVWWQTFKLNSVAQTTLKVQLTISNISSEYWWSQIYRPHYTCWNSRLTAMHIMHPWQSPWLTKIVMSGQFCTFAMFSLIYCCDCLGVAGVGWGHEFINLIVGSFPVVSRRFMITA